MRSSNTPRHRILIVGASVASGQGASSADTTYFGILGRELEKRGFPVEIKIMAGGGWKSSQKILALERQQLGRWNLVVFVDGMNDITLGNRADLLMGQEGDWPTDFQADNEKRILGYIGNMLGAATFCRRLDCKMLVVLQPSPMENKPLTSLERQSVNHHFKERRGGDIVAKCLDLVRQEMHQVTALGAEFLDASRLFDTQTATTFVDLWHFSDPGHELLGLAIAEHAAQML